MLIPLTLVFPGAPARIKVSYDPRIWCAVRRWQAVFKVLRATFHFRSVELEEGVGGLGRRADKGSVFRDPGSPGNPRGR